MVYNKFIFNAYANENGGGMTNEQIVKANVAREQMGLDLLPLSTEEKKDDVVAVTKTQDEQTQKAETKEENEDAVNITATKVETKVDENKELSDEIDEAVMLKALSKKLGREITSLDDLAATKKEITQEDIEAEKQARETNKVKFGLSNGLFTAKEFESFIADAKNPTEVVFKQYVAEQKELDSDLSDAELREEFNEKFGLNEEEDSRKYKRGLKEINLLAENIINSKYPNISQLESKYSVHESTENSTKEQQKVILEKAPLFKRYVELVKDSLKTIRFNISENDGYDINIDDSILNPYIDQMLTPEYTANAIQKGYSVDDLKKIVKNAVLSENIETIVKSIILKDRIKTQKGLKGVIPTRDVHAATVYDTKKQKLADEIAERLGVSKDIVNTPAN